MEICFAPSGATSESSLRPRLARTKPSQQIEATVPLAGEVWTGRDHIRTLSEVPIEFTIDLQETHQYQSISQEAKELFNQGLSYARIAKKLGVTDKTAKKAIMKG